nr:MAG TPA: head closure knob [Caudoviricetes sp.]
MIHGERVTVFAQVKGSEDSYGVPSVEYRAQRAIENVLVAPSGTADLEPGMHPDGDAVTLTLHFPKAFTGSLRSARLAVRGVMYEVVGDPQPYTDANVPGAWNRPVQVRLIEG